MKKDSVGGSLQDRMAAMEAVDGQTFTIKMKQPYHIGMNLLRKHAGNFPAMMLQAFFVLPRIHVVLGSGGHKPFDIERGDPQRSWRGSGNLQSQNRETKNYCVRYS